MAVTWNPSDKAASVTLSGGNLSVSITATQGGVRANISKSAGKWYYEYTIGTNPAYTAVGLANASWSLTTQLGTNANGVGYANDSIYFNNSAIFFAVGALAVGDVVGIAHDADAGTVKFYKNNVLKATCSSSQIPTGALYPAVSNSSNSISGSAVFGLATTYTPPTGYSVYDPTISFTMTGNVGVNVPVAATMSASVGRQGNVRASVGVAATTQFQIVQHYTITPSGGAIVGGTAPVSVVVPNIYTIAPSGGIVIGGSAVVNDNINYVPTGGAVVGGIAPVSFLLVNVYNITPIGGVVVGGTPLIQDNIPFTPTGGALVGGSAVVNSLSVSIYTITPAGGVVAAGIAPSAWVSSFVPSGGVLVSGVNDPATTTVIVPSGGALLAGSAQPSTVFVITPRGGITISGAAVVKDYQAFFAPSGGTVIGGSAVVAANDGIVYVTAENPLGKVYPGWAINYVTFAPSRYRDLPAESITFFGGKAYVANAAGIYAVDAKDDAGRAIRASITTPLSDFMSSRQKRMEVAYLGLRTSARVRLKINAGTASAIYSVVSQSNSTKQKGTKIAIGKGLAARYWNARVDNINGADFAVTNLELVPVKNQRYGT